MKPTYTVAPFNSESGKTEYFVMEGSHAVLGPFRNPDAAQRKVARLNK